MRGDSSLSAAPTSLCSCRRRRTTDSAAANAGTPWAGSRCVGPVDAVAIDGGQSVVPPFGLRYDARRDREAFLSLEVRMVVADVLGRRWTGGRAEDP